MAEGDVERFVAAGGMTDPAARAADAGGPPPSVLVVDDEAPIVEEIAEFLDSQGLRPVTAHGGAEARAKLRADPRICVMVTDVRMPDADGVSLAAEVLAGRDESRAIEVILLTGHGNMDMAVDALRARVFDFLNKPLRLRKLGETVRAAVASAQSRRASARAARAQAPARDGAAAAATIMAVLNDELRTPLVPILGLSELIEQDAAALPDNALSTYAGLIRQSGERLKDVADAFALLGSLELGLAPPRVSPQWPRVVLRGVQSAHAAAARERSQSLVVTATDAPAVTTDGALLRLALDQLAANAIRYTPEQGAVGLSATQRDAEVVFTVDDNGPGMSREQVAAAMHAFMPLGDVLRRSHRGLGLGLTLAAKLARVLGGRLEIDSTPGHGTRASIALPLDAPPAPA